jgi:uncharacterized lipoprotein NlpE involved in copper resistance
MKHSLYFALMIMLVTASCNNNSSSSTSETKTDSSTQDLQQDNSVSKPDNSANSLDWQGTYSGVVPCADCEGIELSIILTKDNTYSITTKYLGKQNAAPSETRGMFSWNPDGSTITLRGIENWPSQYLVGENKLIQLDSTGNKISGALADKYILNKK